MNTTRFFFRLCMLGLLFAAGALLPQAHARAEEDQQPTKITLHPAAEARPALRYQLLPPLIERTSGNAAVYYGKVKAEENTFFGNAELQDKLAEWDVIPLDELREDKSKSPVQGNILEALRRGDSNWPTAFFNAVNGTIFDYLRRGARCTYCDWQHPFHEGNYYSTLLPEVQESRQYARILAVRARIQIARGDYDGSLATLQTAYALGRNVAETDSLVAGLVGIAICGVMNEQVMTWIQQPDAPNLYWALTMLPSPLVSMRRGFEGELFGLELSIPELGRLQESRSAEQWRELLDRVWNFSFEFRDDPKTGLPNKVEMLTACLRGYPLAKQALIAQGMSAEKVEAMPVAQVILLYEMRVYRELVDDCCKTNFLSVPEAAPQLRRMEERLRQAIREQREIIPLASILLPAVNAVRQAQTRTERKVAVLRILEALRIYAAEHSGALPPSLAEIATAPCPDDPLTGQPFFYETSGKRAWLRGPAMTGEPCNYEITMENLPSASH